MTPPSNSPAGFIDPTRFTPFFSKHGGQLYCEGVPLRAIAERYGTPAYVYTSAGMRSAYHKIDRAFGRWPHTLCYSVKANSNRSVLQLFARLGAWFDIVSGGELYRLRRAGIPAQRVVFSGVGKTPEEIREALRADIFLFNVESEAELNVLAAEASRLRQRARVGLRINPNVTAGGHPHIATGHGSHKFGVDWQSALDLYRSWQHSRWICCQGISAHIGSQILSVAPFRRAAQRLGRFVRKLSLEGISLKYLDFGGGVGVRYTTERPLDLRQYSRALLDVVRPLGCHLLLEPGRSLVGSAGVLLTRVILTKESRHKRFVVVDAAMNDFLRPALYSATHPITQASAAEPAAASQAADMVGPICETGDCFLQGWPGGDVQAGDLLVVWGTGAYGFSLASNYNSRPRPAEIMVEGTRARLVRRRETRSDLVRGE
jgi:diaminopimelate decarboxylase